MSSIKSSCEIWITPQQVSSGVDVGIEHQRAIVELLSFGRNIRNDSQVQIPVITAAASIATANDRKVATGENSSPPDAAYYRYDG